MAHGSAKSGRSSHKWGSSHTNCTEGKTLAVLHSNYLAPGIFSCLMHMVPRTQSYRFTRPWLYISLSCS